MLEFLKKKKCVFCARADGELQKVPRRDYFDWYFPKQRYYFHEECLRNALGASKDRAVIDVALDIIRNVRREAEWQKRAREWRKAKLEAARGAASQLESDLRELYG